ncbi:hypothetical protein [Sulfitobacter sp. MF3-043]|uniref:hypothetical protein n=1 Tax=Sulfitobacter sediminivivens TaxID=3252902 RepID=UPI0036DAF446
MLRLSFVILGLLAAPGLVLAEAGSLFSGSTMAVARGGVIPVRGTVFTAPRSSLFIGRAEMGLFADPPAHEPVYDDASYQGVGGADAVHIRHLIGQAESRRDGYDAVQHGARIKPAKQPTKMTLGEIYQWIEDTPGQPHAIGRYQFIPKTLLRVARKIGALPDQRFSPQLQDRLADVLLAEAGLHEFRAGKLSRVSFMNNLAKIWAGLPTSSGRSYYDGYAGNKASMTWARFDAEMARVEPG